VVVVVVNDRRSHFFIGKHHQRLVHVRNCRVENNSINPKDPKITKKGNAPIGITRPTFSLCKFFFYLTVSSIVAGLKIAGPNKNRIAM
jgi:hypothetical protein